MFQVQQHSTNVAALMGGAAVLLQDGLSGVNGTSINGRTPDTVGAGTWSILAGTLTIQSNRAQGANSGTRAPAVYDVGVADCTVQCDIIKDPSGLSSGGIVVRATDANNYIFIELSEGADRIQIWKYEAGVAGNLGFVTLTVDPSATYTLQVVMNGTAIRASVGATTVTGTSSFNQSATKHGFHLQWLDKCDNMLISPSFS